MPKEISKKPIVFENKREATAVFPPAGAKAKEIIGALALEPTKALILVIGGADAVAENLKPRLIQLFGRGIARAAVEAKAVIIDGGTESGVMAMMGQGVADRGYRSQLIGVAPTGKVTYPGSNGAGNTKIDSNHSHFVLVEGNDWGSELSTIYELAEAFTKKSPGVVILASGGPNSRNEALYAARQNLPLIVVEGSGGLSDEIATAWKARPNLPDDPVMAEIIADGRIYLHPLSDSVKSAERLILRELGGDNVLIQAWERFADYDLNAVLQQRRFDWMQGAILAVGLLATFLALIKQVRAPKNEDGSDAIVKYSLWWFVYYLLIVMPIALTVLITAANRFKQGNKWLLLRAGAESIKREIFRYRARANDYKETINVSAPAPGTSPPSPSPTPDQVLAQRVEDITRRVMRTEVNSSSLIPYDKSKGFPPYMYAADGGDDGFSMLTPDGYVQVRLTDQLSYYKRKAVTHEHKLRFLQWSIFVIGGAGTLLAAINQQVWIALTTALVAAFTTYLSYKQTENTLMKYNQAATDLDNVKAWWTALPAAEQAKQENVDTLVAHTEQVLQSELDGWVQQMQNALAELRKGQTSANEGNETRGGAGSELNKPKEQTTNEPPVPDNTLPPDGTQPPDESSAPDEVPSLDETQTADETQAPDETAGEQPTDATKPVGDDPNA